MHFSKIFQVAACVATLAAISSASISAVDAAPRKRPVAAVTGLAAMHDMRTEGGRLCFSEHFHYGSSTGQKNVKAAQAAAIQSWADFVIFEYDPSWASFNRASSKEMKCSQGSGGWSCDASARPCR